VRYGHNLDHLQKEVVVGTRILSNNLLKECVRVSLCNYHVCWPIIVVVETKYRRIELVYTFKHDMLVSNLSLFRKISGKNTRKIKQK